MIGVCTMGFSGGVGKRIAAASESVSAILDQGIWLGVAPGVLLGFGGQPRR